MKKMPITKEGLENLKKQLIHLQRVERPENIQAIAEAEAMVI